MLFVHADTTIFGSIFILRQIAGRGIVHVHILKYSKKRVPNWALSAQLVDSTIIQLQSPTRSPGLLVYIIT